MNLEVPHMDSNSLVIRTSRLLEVSNVRIMQFEIQEKNNLIMTELPICNSKLRHSNGNESADDEQSRLSINANNLGSISELDHQEPNTGNLY